MTRWAGTTRGRSRHQPAPVNHGSAASDAFRETEWSDALEARFVWMMGSPRTGSTWLLRMLDQSSRVVAIDEPYLGVHLVPRENPSIGGEYFSHGPRSEDNSYLFARRHVAELQPLMREIVARGVALQAGIAPDQTEPPFVLLKEPNGSHAAETIMWLLPRSRLLFVLRDGRDVVDSMADAVLNRDSWWHESHGDAAPPVPARERFLRESARLWVGRTQATMRAFNSLPEAQRLLVRYEDLRADPGDELSRVFGWLAVVPPRSAETIAREHAFEALPETDRGLGKVTRAAQPGLWREHFSLAEQEMLIEIMGPCLQEMDYEV